MSSMVFNGTRATTGTLLSAGGGFIQSAPGVTFFGQPYSATQATPIMTGAGPVSWTGTNALGPWSYNATLTAGQSAVGLLFNWNTNNGIAVFEVFNCNDDGSGDACIGGQEGAAGNMQNGPFVGQNPNFNGVEVSAVPVPAAAWLMASGLLGLVGVARRRKA